MSIWSHAIVVSYTSGLLAALSPCVIVLIPLLLYRFALNEPKKQTYVSIQRTAIANRSSIIVCDDNNSGTGSDKPVASRSSTHRAILIFIAGFQISYLLFGYFLSKVLTSSIQNGFKIGLGGLFIMLSAMSCINRLDPLQMPLFKNTFLMGVSFALLLSFNPCTVPFLAVIISLNTADALMALCAFGQGLLTPALLFVYVGRGCLTAFKKKAKWMAMINKFMAGMLAIMGIYLVLSVHTVSFSDMLVAAVISFGTMILAMCSLGLIEITSPRTATRTVKLIVVLWIGVLALFATSCHIQIYLHERADASTPMELMEASSLSPASPVSTTNLHDDDDHHDHDAHMDASSPSPSSPPSSATNEEAPVRYSYRRQSRTDNHVQQPIQQQPTTSDSATDTDETQPMDPLHAPASFLHHANEHAEAEAVAAVADNDILTIDDMANLTCQDTSRVPVCHPCLLCIRLFLALSIVAAVSAMAFHFMESLVENKDAEISSKVLSRVVMWLRWCTRPAATIDV